MWLFVGTEEAKNMGFTHHGSYYGFPCYLNLDGGGVAVMEKVPLLGWVIPVISAIENTIGLIIKPYEEQGFVFTVKGEL